MSNPEAKVQSLLRQYRFRLVRQTKHLVYVNPEGRVFVTSSTPSDYRFAHNQLTSLKRCLAAPPVPMVLAISQFEREQAAAIIQAAPRTKVGVSSGRHHRSRGTGFIYEDPKVLTVEQLAEREKLAEAARVVAARREQHHQERRARKLAEKAAKIAQKEQEEQEFQAQCSIFLKETRKSLEYVEARFLRTCRVVQESRIWSKDIFYEFATNDEDKLSEKAAKQAIQIFVLPDDRSGATLDELDQVHADFLEEMAQAANASSTRFEKIMRFVEKRLRQDPDILSLLWDVHGELTSYRWSHLIGYGYECVMKEFFSNLRELILRTLNFDESPDRLAAVICDGGNDDAPEFRVLLADDGEDNELGNPVRGIPTFEESMPEQVEETVNDEDVVVEEILALARGEAA